MAERPRVVFDCNVFLLAAARQKSVAASCFNLAEKGRLQLFISKEVLLEIEDVLNRSERFRTLKVIEPLDLLSRIEN